MIRPTTDLVLDELTCQAMREVKKEDFPHFTEQEFGLLPAYHNTIGTLAFDSFVKATHGTQHTMLHLGPDSYFKDPLEFFVFSGTDPLGSGPS